MTLLLLRVSGPATHEHPAVEHNRCSHEFEHLHDPPFCNSSFDSLSTPYRFALPGIVGLYIHCAAEGPPSRTSYFTVLLSPVEPRWRRFRPSRHSYEGVFLAISVLTQCFGASQNFLFGFKNGCGSLPTFFGDPVGMNGFSPRGRVLCECTWKVTPQAAECVPIE